MSEVSAVGGTAPVSSLLPFVSTAISQPQPSNSTAARPAVVVSLSSGATTSSKTISNLGALDPLQVEEALSVASSANGLVALYKNADWAEVGRKFGQADEDRGKAEMLGAIAQRSSSALSEGLSLGLPITETTTPSTTSGGPALPTINIGAFSFTSGGSTYVVKPGADGTLVGTKDGQAWLTIQFNAPTNLADAGAATALKTLTSATARQQDTASKTRSGVDISA